MIDARWNAKRTAPRAAAAMVAGLMSVTLATSTPVSAAAVAPSAPGIGIARPVVTSAPSAAMAPGTFVALTSARVYDGRTNGVAAPHATVGVPVLGHAGVPSTGVGAIAMTLTATGQTSSGYVTAYPAGTARPTTSNLNFVPGQDVANSVVMPAGSGGEVELYNGSAGPTDFIVDVAGYYLSGPASVAGAFTATAPTRRLDTRTGTGGHQPAARAVVRVNVGISGATVLMNLTVTGPTAAGYVTAYADGTTRPVTSTLNFGAGQTIANETAVAVGANGIVDLYNGAAGTTQLVLDIVGDYRLGSAATPGALQPVPPRRQLDTRTPPGRTLRAHSALADAIGGTAGIPATGVSALMLNITVVAPSRSGYLRAQAVGGFGTVPTATSSLNFAAGHTQAGLVIVAAGAGGQIEFYLGSSGSADVVVDVLGYTLDGPGASRGSITGPVYVLNQLAGGVTVRAYDGTDIAATAVTAADGTYILAGLPASTDGYVVCAVAPNDAVAGRCYRDVEWDGTTPAPASTPVPVQGGTLYGGIFNELREPLPTGVITGQLTAADTGKPLAGEHVEANNPAPGGFRGLTATTASDGTYTITGLDPGSYGVCFTAYNTAAGTPPTGYANACHAGEVAVTDGHTTANVDGVLPIGAAVSGRVTATADAAAITNVTVQVHDTNGNVIGYATTAADGQYRIIGLTGGTAVTVCFSGTDGTGGPSVAGYLNACYHIGAGTDATPVTVTAGSTKTGINVSLASGGGISGTVRAGTAGVDGIEVDVYSSNGDRNVVALSGADGTYTITGMLPGTYTVCFEYDDERGGTAYRDQCYHDVVWDGGVPLPTGAQPVAVTAGVTTDNIDASLIPL